MMAMTHHLMATKVWWDKPIMLCILPPKGRQVRKYIAKKGSHPSGTQTHMQGRGVGIQPLPSPEEGLSKVQTSMSQAQPTRDVWDLDNDQLQQVLKALQIKMAKRERVAPLLGSPMENPRAPRGSSEPITDDGK